MARTKIADWLCQRALETNDTKYTEALVWLSPSQQVEDWEYLMNLCFPTIITEYKNRKEIV